MDNLRVVIFTVNSKGKTHDDMYLCKDMIEVSRILITFKPKKGYEFEGSEITAI